MLSKILIFWCIFFIYINTTFALSCAPSSPKIGVLSKISIQDKYSQLQLKNLKTFDTSRILQNELYSIDEYRWIVWEYIQNNAWDPIPENLFNPDIISVEAHIFQQIDVEVWDIIIQWPPFHVCDYSLIWIFSSEWKLKYTLAKDNYKNYTYEGETLIVTPGKEIDCSKQYCSVEIEYIFWEDSFILAPWDTYTSSWKTLFFSLFEASNYNTSSDGILHDWWMWKYVSYMIDFTGEEKTESCKDINSTQTEDDCSGDDEVSNIFVKFFNWLKSFFM